MTSPDVKAYAKQQEIKEMLAVSYHFYKKYMPSKPEIRYKIGVYFSLTFGCYFIQLDFVS